MHSMLDMCDRDGRCSGFGGHRNNGRHLWCRLRREYRVLDPMHRVMTENVPCPRGLRHDARSSRAGVFRPAAGGLRGPRPVGRLRRAREFSDCQEASGE